MQTDRTTDRPPTRPKLGVVTPLANEEATIEAHLDGVLVHLQPHDRLFCVLDRVCKDRTRELIQGRAERDARVVLVWAPENRCVVDAYVRGYREALAAGCEWILEMDGGSSHLPEQIPQFLQGMAEGYDYVGGSRFMRGGCHRSPWTRVLISWGGGVLSNGLLGTRMTDMTGGFECFRRPALEYVLARGIMSRANFFQTEIRFFMHRFRWLEVPIRYTNPNYSLGRAGLKEAFRNLWRLRQLRQSEPPPAA